MISNKHIVIVKTESLTLEYEHGLLLLSFFDKMNDSFFGLLIGSGSMILR